MNKILLLLVNAGFVGYFIGSLIAFGNYWFPIVLFVFLWVNYKVICEERDY